MIRLLCLLALLLPSAAMAQSDNRIGERAFQRCYSCHSLAKGEKGLSGPNLNALNGRPIASDPDFEYSKAFKKFATKGKRWSPALLDRFLADPESVAPGNQMGFFGLKDAKERAAIVAYIMGKN
jgi:cytochrome c2